MAALASREVFVFCIGGPEVDEVPPSKQQSHLAAVKSTSASTAGMTSELQLSAGCQVSDCLGVSGDSRSIA